MNQKLRYIVSTIAGFHGIRYLMDSPEGFTLTGDPARAYRFCAEFKAQMKAREINGRVNKVFI